MLAKAQSILSDPKISDEMALAEVDRVIEYLDTQLSTSGEAMESMGMEPPKRERRRGPRQPTENQTVINWDDL